MLLDSPSAAQGSVRGACLSAIPPSCNSQFRVTFTAFLNRECLQTHGLRLNIPVPLEADLTCLDTKLLADKFHSTLHIDRK